MSIFSGQDDVDVILGLIMGVIMTSGLSVLIMYGSNCMDLEYDTQCMKLRVHNADLNSKISETEVPSIMLVRSSLLHPDYKREEFAEPPYDPSSFKSLTTIPKKKLLSVAQAKKMAKEETERRKKAARERKRKKLKAEKDEKAKNKGGLPGNNKVAPAQSDVDSSRSTGGGSMTEDQSRTLTSSNGSANEAIKHIFTVQCPTPTPS